MIKVVVSGAVGRLGSKILDRVSKADDLELVAGLVRPGSDLAGQALHPHSDQTYEIDAAELLRKSVVLVETAPPLAAMEHAELALSAGAPILMATTGLDAKQRSRLEAMSAQIPVVLAPNLSAGVAVLTELVARAASALRDYDLEILEIHHRRKRDAPSGTAWSLANAAASARGQEAEKVAILARAGETGPRSDTEVGLQALRGGDVVGEHTVFLMGETERLELSHRASSRDVFADGALRAIRFLGEPDRSPGLYGMSEVLGLKG